MPAQYNPPQIILVSSGQPSLNPRLVKEADSLTLAGYNVTVLYAYWNDWGTVYDDTLLSTRKWKAVRVGGAPGAKSFTYFTTRVINKAAKLFGPRLFSDKGISRATFSLVREAKKHKADLYIAHNLGALPAAVNAAKKHNKPCGFDAEDFHRNETGNDKSDPEVIRKSYIEDKYIPQLTYFTTSSPQIAEQYRQLFPGLNPVVLLNVFNKSNTHSVKVHKPLKLFWFSQTIGPARGIEDVVKALSTLKKSDFELHLLGDRPALNKGFIDKIMLANINVKFHDPIAPDDIIPFAAQFDIGLALEPAFSINNDLALSNKIFTYLQAGLAIVASKTTAQADFMKQNPAIGSSYQIGDSQTLAAVVEGYHKDDNKLMACKEASLKLGHGRYNWETESQKFLNLVKETI